MNGLVWAGQIRSKIIFLNLITKRFWIICRLSKSKKGTIFHFRKKETIQPFQKQLTQQTGTSGITQNVSQSGKTKQDVMMRRDPNQQPLPLLCNLCFFYNYKSITLFFLYFIFIVLCKNRIKMKTM